MPKLVNRPPKYSFHKPSGQAKVRYNGKDTYLGRHGSQESLEAYAAFIAKLPKPGETVRLIEPSPGATLLVGECVLRFYQHAEGYYLRNGVPTGEHVTIRCALQPLVKRFGHLPTRELGPKKLKQVREDMIALGWSRSTINKATNRIKLCFAWCASEEFISAEIAMGLKTVAGLRKNRTAAKEKAPIGPVPDEDIDAVLPHVSELVCDVCRLMRLTGMRPGCEAMAMRGEEIDRTDPTCWVYRPGHHKTEHHGKGRSVFIGEKAQAILLPWLLKAGDDKLFVMTLSALRRAILRGCKKAGVPDWHPNQIRHTFGTEVRSKYGLEGAQVLLGHSRADVTQTYAERDLGKAVDIVRKIG